MDQNTSFSYDYVATYKYFVFRMSMTITFPFQTYFTQCWSLSDFSLKLTKRFSLERWICIVSLLCIFLFLSLHRLSFIFAILTFLSLHYHLSFSLSSNYFLSIVNSSFCLFLKLSQYQPPRLSSSLFLIRNVPFLSSSPPPFLSLCSWSRFSLTPFFFSFLSRNLS